ncbi:MAG: signal recognition particle-docking protein FtsY [Chloroflexi bacterium]|nr:signal recognition particle-docking protein FtsY [Chloroflexota bacterium]
MFNIFRRSEKTDKGVKRTREAWFGRVTRLFERAEYDESLWDELEELLIGADVGVATTMKLIERVRARADKERLRQASQVEDVLKEEMVRLLESPSPAPPLPIGRGETAVILMVGVNGVGKTTCIAKLANAYMAEGRQVVTAAGDTFRAAAIDQLRLWGERIGFHVVAHQPGADSAAVAFDALQSARSRGADLLLIDTAGRMHTKFNLMEELKKVKRVLSRIDPTAPDQVLLVLDATTGQNGLSQAKTFVEAVGVNGIVLAKLDGTAKGGIILAICDEIKIPVLYIGTGEQPDDLVPFDAREFVGSLFRRDE